MTLTKMISQLAGGMFVSIQIFMVTLIFSLPLGMVVAFGSDIHGEEKTYSHYSKVMKKLGKRADEVQQKTYELMKTYA